MGKTSNQRADFKNPNNPAYKAAMDNRSVQLNVNATNEKVVAVKVEPTAKK